MFLLNKSIKIDLYRIINNIFLFYLKLITPFDFSFKRSLYSASVNLILNTISFQSTSLRLVRLILILIKIFYSSLGSFFILEFILRIPPAKDGPDFS